MLEWIHLRGDRYAYNDAPSYGAVTAEIAVRTESVPLFKLWTDGNLQVMFKALARTKAYAEPEARAELLQRIADVSGSLIKSDAIDRSPCVRLSALTGDRCAKLLAIFDDAVRRLKEA